MCEWTFYFSKSLKKNTFLIGGLFSFDDLGCELWRVYDALEIKIGNLGAT